MESPITENHKLDELGRPAGGATHDPRSMSDWTFVTDDECPTERLDALVRVIQESDAGDATIIAFDTSGGAALDTISVARLNRDLFAAVSIDRSHGRVVWAWAEIEACSEPTGWHDDGDPMLCTLPPGHENEHSHHGSGEPDVDDIPVLGPDRERIGTVTDVAIDDDGVVRVEATIDDGEADRLGLTGPLGPFSLPVGPEAP